MKCTHRRHCIVAIASVPYNTSVYDCTHRDEKTAITVVYVLVRLLSCPFHYPKAIHNCTYTRCTHVSLHEALRSNGRQHDGLELRDGAGEVGA